jgi:hypothetical protein
MRRTALPTFQRTSIPLLPHCPYLKHAAADWLWPVEGFCRARADGQCMVPAVPHYLHLCATGDYHLCEAFRARTPAPGDPVTA